MIIDGLEEISLTVEQTDTDQWQAQIARCLAMVACQNAEATRINWKTLMKTELETKICHLIIRVQTCRCAVSYRFRMIGIIGRKNAVVIGQKYLIFCRFQQQRLIHALEKSLRVMPHCAPKPGCRRENSERVERSQLYQRSLANSSSRARRGGIFGLTAIVNTVPETCVILESEELSRPRGIVAGFNLNPVAEISVMINNIFLY